LIRFLVYVPLAAVIGAIFFFVVFFDFGRAMEFAELPAGQARSRMSNWPELVATDDVHTVSYKSESSIDGFSSWYCIKLRPMAASVWADALHNDRAEWGQRCMHEGHSGYEGVKRAVAGPPPLHRTTGETPDWWRPPGGDFRATEVMLWYDRESGVGGATYSAFDPSSGTLWLYDYACQHDILWDRGDVPDGETFSGGHDAERHDAPERGRPAD